MEKSRGLLRSAFGDSRYPGCNGNMVMRAQRGDRSRVQRCHACTNPFLSDTGMTSSLAISTSLLYRGNQIAEVLWLPTPPSGRRISLLWTPPPNGRQNDLCRSGSISGITS